MKPRRFVIILLILGGTWATLTYLPWWTSIVAAFLAVFLFQSSPIKYSFWLYGFFGSLVWVGLAIFADLQNQHILGPKMTALFHLPSSTYLFIIQGLIGFISTGLGAWLGNIMRGTEVERNYFSRIRRG